MEGEGGVGVHSLSDSGWLIGSEVRGSRSMYPSPRREGDTLFSSGGICITGYRMYTVCSICFCYIYHRVGGYFICLLAAFVFVACVHIYVKFVSVLCIH